MAYNWWKFLHILGVFAFLTSHGVSITVLYRIRRERDRKKVLDLVTLSGETTIPMYVSLVVLVVAGVIAGIQGHWFTGLTGHPRHTWWIWGAILILVLTGVLMWALARPYFAKVKTACEVRPSGVPRHSDEELMEILTSSRAHAISLVGGVGLLAILYLMVFKPGL
jgi:uncharacterized membrane protein